MRLPCPILVLVFFFLSCGSKNSEKLNNGLYQNVQDSLAFISVESNKIVLGHRDYLNSPDEMYNYVILDSAIIRDKYEKGKFLLLTGKSDSLLYSGLKYDENSISMFFVPRGNFVEYTKVPKR